MAQAKVINLSPPQTVLAIVNHLQKNGFQSWLVGGALRDSLLGISSYDWDFATDATPPQILHLFPNAFYDNQFGTVRIAFKHLKSQFHLSDSLDDNLLFDITTFRSEFGYSDKRRPDKVIWGKTIQEDLQRRDFTINALAARYVSDQWLLTDPHNGLQDLTDKLIRAVGDPQQRFQEDALRMLRAIRFAAQLGFTIESQTFQAITHQASSITAISWERIRDELLRLLSSPHPADGILLLVNTGLANYILPELVAGKNIPQAGHHIYDVFTHSVESLRHCPSRDPIVRLATLLHDIGKPVTFKKDNDKITFYNHEVVGARLAKKIAARLRLSKKDQEKIFTLVRWHMFSYDSQMTDAAIRRFITKVGKDNIHDMILLRIGDRLGSGSKATSWRLNEFQRRIGHQLYQPLTLKDLAINGHDLMHHLHLKPSPLIGKLLNHLFQEILENPQNNNPSYLLTRARQLLPTLAE